jgi:hypothetical protein
MERGMSDEPSPTPEHETLAEALAREKKKTEDLGAKIDAVEKEVAPKHPQTPGVGGMVGD